MEELRNNNAFKTLEVIWNRNKNIHRLKCLPEIKEINIDDSVKKVKKMSRLNKFERAIDMNENGIEHAHKRVKKRLFQEKVDEKVPENLVASKLNKIHNKTHSDNFTTMSQIKVKRSPPILSSREKSKRNNFKQRLFQTKSPKTAERSPTHSEDSSIIKSSCIVDQIFPSTKNILRTESPEIMSHRKQRHIDEYREKMSSNESSLSDNNKSNKKHCGTLSHNLIEISQNELTKSPPNLSSREKSKRNNFKQRLFQTKSPKTAERSPTHSEDSSIIKSSCDLDQIFPSTKNVLRTKSPEIMSHRKRRHTDEYPENITSNESSFSDNNKSNKKHCETLSHNLIEIPQNELTKSPPIVSSREKSKRNNFKQRLFQTKSPKTAERSPTHSEDSSIIKSSCVLDQIFPSTKNVLRTKSPEIMSHRKRRHTDEFPEKNSSNESSFPDNNKSNKIHSETLSHNLIEIPQNELTKSPPNLSSREKSKRNNFKQRLFQTKSPKTAERSPTHSEDSSIIKSSCVLDQIFPSTKNVLRTKSPEIMSHRKRRHTDEYQEKISSNESSFSDNNKSFKKHCETLSHNLIEIPQNELTKSPPNLSSRGKSKRNNFKQRLFQTKSPKTAERSPTHSEDSSIIKSSCVLDQIFPSTKNVLRTKSPEIMSHRKRRHTDEYPENITSNESSFPDNNKSNKIHCETLSHNLIEIPQNELTKSPPNLSSREKSKRNNFKQRLFQTKSPKTAERSPTHSEDSSIIKSSCVLNQIFPSTKNVLRTKSPEIMSHRKRRHTDEFPEKNSSNESSFPDNNKSNKIHSETLSHNLIEIPQNELTKSPPNLSSREKSKRNNFKQRLFQTKSPKTAERSPTHSEDSSIIKSSCVLDQIFPSTKNVLRTKSPEIMSHRKRRHTDEYQEKISSNESSFSDNNKSFKKHCETLSHNLIEIPQNELTKSPPNLSSREKSKRNNFKQRLFQTKSPKTAERSPTHSEDSSIIKSSCVLDQIFPSTKNVLRTKSPEIMSHRKRRHTDEFPEKNSSNESSFPDNNKSNKIHSETLSHNLIEIPQNELTKSPPNLSSREKSKRNNFKQRLFQTKSPKTAERSPTHSEDSSIIKSSCVLDQIFPSTKNVLRTKSPEIMSHRKRRHTDEYQEKISSNESSFSDNNKSFKKHCETLSHNLIEIPQNELTKSPPNLSSREKSKRNNFKQRLFQTKSPKTAERSPTHSEDSSIIKSSCVLDQIFPSTKNVLRTKSPEIMSHRKRRHTDEYQEKISSNESSFSDNNKSFKKHCETHSYNLIEILQNELSKSPPIVSSREKSKRNNFKQHLYQTKSPKTAERSPTHSEDSSIIKSSCVVHQILPNTINSLYNKSSENMSNHKQQCKLLEKKNSNNTLNMNYNYVPQASRMLNEKSEQINTRRSKVKLKLNFEDTEDIIESSEIINVAIKKKSNKNKNRSEKKNTKNNIHENVTHELKCITDGKNEKLLIKDSSIAEKVIKSYLCDDTNDSLDIINTENILMPAEINIKKKNPQKKSTTSLTKSKKDQICGIIEPSKNKDDILKYLITSSTYSKKSIETSKVDLITLKSQNANENKDKSISITHSPSDVRLIPATPEHNSIIVNEAAVECSSETVLKSYIPQIEVYKSPKTPLNKNRQVLIQSVFTPPNVDSSKLPVLFEPVVSPTQSFINSELSFKIDSVESPSAVHKCEHFVSPEMIKKKLDKSPSPNCYDSAKKRKKIFKDGLRGKFRELINRKKSEARIREYEKNLSINNQSKHGETILLNVIDVWKEFKTFLLFCYFMKSETQVQKVIVTLDNCPKNATKNSVIRIYSPWMTMESKTADIMLFVGVIYAEVIEYSGSNKPLGPTGQFTNISGLSSNVFQSEVKWKCNCSEEAPCQCLGESSVYNYLQYMISD